jgi:predicted HAD superfamily Cof-like phosphohydrolase
MYLDLIREEYKELLEAQGLNSDHVRIGIADPVETVDALIDILVVTIGALHSMGADAEGAWQEVMRSNFSKIAEDGKVKKREDGKVLKPEGYSPPNLAAFVTKG